MLSQPDNILISHFQKQSMIRYDALYAWLYVILIILVLIIKININLK